MAPTLTPSRPPSKRTWIFYGLFILFLHLAGVGLLIVNAQHNPMLWGMGLLAYSFGLRHAFDVDHIAAIDNTVRKLVEQRRNPDGIGFYFSLGHSTVVFLLAIATAFSVQWVQQHMPEFKEVGSLIGITVSGVFLVAIGLLNLFILLGLLRLFRSVRQGQVQTEQFEQLLESRGFFARLLRPFYKLISRSWHVYPLGFLFGLGFDTATEISVLTLSAHAAEQSLSLWTILAFPTLFAAGMCMMDTADGIFMTRAYRWAFATPIRKLYYNVTVTAISVVAALFIGMLELAQVISRQFDLQGVVWEWVQAIDFGELGYALVGMFVVSWLVSMLVWRRMGLSAGPGNRHGQKQGEMSP